MRDLAILFLHLITTSLRLLRPGGARSIIAESLLVKQQLLIINRSRQRGPNLRTTDRVVTGLCALLMHPNRLARSAIILRPSAVLAFHRNLVKRKYRLLFSPIQRGTPGPKGSSQELINAIVAMKQRNPDWGCPRIAAQISLAFGITLDKDVVCRVLARHYRPTSGGDGPSWLTFLGQMKELIG
jgi:putative transposase